MIRKLDHEQVKKIALTFATKAEFASKDGSAYNCARRNKILESICSHMINMQDKRKIKRDSKTKICSCCKRRRLKHCFAVQTSSCDGFQAYCNECSGRASATFYKTEKGVIGNIYLCQKNNSKVRGHNMPQYTKSQLEKWLYLNGFKQLYKKWVESNYMKDLKPSVDRLDDNKGYYFENIRLTTWRSNYVKSHKQRLKGESTSGSVCKKVYQYNKQGKMLKEFFSQAEAQRCTGVFQANISKVCQGERKFAGGFGWSHVRK